MEVISLALITYLLFYSFISYNAVNILNKANASPKREENLKGDQLNLSNLLFLATSCAR
jgi:hypothetical protein